jgi:hypothetical protein
MSTTTLTPQQISSETRAALVTCTQETLYRPAIINYPRTMPPHGLPTCPQCDRPVRHHRAAGHCSARCLMVANVLSDM